MLVRVLCDDEPPEALVRAAKDARSCPSCGGLIELNQRGGLWFAMLAHEAPCAWCTPSELNGAAAPVVSLTGFRST